ncbi:acetoacetate decarboxylase family protein [Pseudoalteromonas denitrificans]|uniref:Acetoacetate decarboxylase (ADC) n=1 Tax=Pseudoalteromonas denitrificans DSM 6059 TaxID=1123010 RepID=A0A1I1RT67_9GAMM|nr:acetoacetate decarboxylase family protein [Pseudoalteromonas denitrificans]SFD37312.1 Acetoacetate decarboxylase (ADC) [Pseudoalteromonas denitrificans DSM 6059]
MSSEFTPYAQFPGGVIAQPPCRMLNANMYGFFVKGDINKIQNYLDETLGLVKEYHFKAISQYCMLTFTDIENIKPTTEPWASQGYFQETDVIIWLPVAKMQDDKIKHIYWYPAFICVNNIYALINGRETWGFNKYLCDYVMPAKGQSPDYFSMTVDAFKTYSPDTKMASCELFNVKMVAKDTESAIENFVDLVKEGMKLLESEVNFFDMDFSVYKQLLSGFINPKIDQLLFKQLPNGDATNAVYQNVLHSPSVIQKFHSGCLYFHEFEFTLNQVDMFPLSDMFGIKVGSQRPLLPFNMLFDFNQEAALNL